MSAKYTVRRTASTDYQLEDDNGNVLKTWTQQSEPDVPDGIADVIVEYAKNNTGGTTEAVRMLLVGFAYRDDT